MHMVFDFLGGFCHHVELRQQEKTALGMIAASIIRRELHFFFFNTRSFMSKVNGARVFLRAN